MRFDPCSFIRIIERGFCSRMSRRGDLLVVHGASRLTDSAREMIRKHKQVLLPHLPPEDGN